MKTLKKALCLILASLMLCFLCACGSASNTDYNSNKSDTEKITTSSQAINAVKNYMSGSPFSLEQEIAAALDFNNFYPPDYATSSATQQNDGSWDVTIKGKMSGYVDEYNDDFETYKFEVSATVSESGRVRISARKVS